MYDQVVVESGQHFLRLFPIVVVQPRPDDLHAATRGARKATLSSYRSAELDSNRTLVHSCAPMARKWFSMSHSSLDGFVVPFWSSLDSGEAAWILAACEMGGLYNNGRSSPWSREHLR